MPIRHQEPITSETRLPVTQIWRYGAPHRHIKLWAADIDKSYPHAGIGEQRTDALWDFEEACTASGVLSATLIALGDCDPWGWTITRVADPDHDTAY